MPRKRYDGEDWSSTNKFVYEKIYNDKHITKSTIGANALYHLLACIKDFTTINENDYQKTKEIYRLATSLYKNKYQSLGVNNG